MKGNKVQREGKQFLLFQERTVNMLFLLPGGSVGM